MFALRTLLRRPAKTFAMVFGLLASVVLIAAVLFLSDALIGEASRGQSALPDIVVQKLVAGRPATVRVRDAEKIRGFASVASVRPRIWGYFFSSALQGNVTVIGVDEDASALQTSTGVLAKGRDRVPGNHEMLAGRTLADALGLRVGDTLALPSERRETPALTLVGTFASDLDLYAADVVLCDQADARILLGIEPGEATDFAVTVTNPAESRVIATSIIDAYPTHRVVEKALTMRVYTLGYGRRSGLILAFCLPALLCLLILLADRLSGASARERQEIAILKAVGWSTEDVLYTKILEALLVAGFATGFGLALAYLWVFPGGAAGLRPVLVGFSVLYPETHFTPMVDLTQLFAIAAAVLAPYVAVCVVPAWRAAQVDPQSAMRGE